MRKEFVLGHAARRPCLDVDHLQAREDPHPRREVFRVPPGVHGDVVPPSCQRGRKCRHVNVLPAGVDSAESRQRAGMLRNHRNFHWLFLS